MEISKKIFNFAIILLALFATFACSLLVYYTYWGKDKLPSSVSSTYATTVTDPQTGEELPTLEAKYYANKNGNGYEVVEFKVNAYSGVSKSAIYARGFQMVWDKDGNIVTYTDSTGATSNIWYYDSADGTSFVSGHEYEWDDKMIIDIEGTTYAVALDGKYSVTNYSTDGWKIVRTIGCLGLNFLFEDTNFTNETTETYNYTFEDLLLKIRSIVKSQSNATGDSTISLIDLGDFLHIYAYDEESATFSNTPVGGNTDNALTNSYFSMAVHYDTRGMVWTKQSMFGSVAGDSTYNKSGLDDNVSYWKSYAQVNLTESDFEQRYSQSDNGYYYSLSTETISTLKNYENVQINVTFNVSNLKVNVLGFDYYALNGLEINSLSITSKTQRDFNLLVSSLKDTGLTADSITTENINLINTNSGVSL